MSYWLVCLPRVDLEHCMKVGTFGLPRKHILGGVKKGDMVICCAGKGDWKIVGTGVVTTDYYVDVEKKFLAEGYFPDRFDFTSVQVPKDRELDVMQIIDQFSFVKNLAYWAVFFRNGIVKAEKSDWDLIKNALQQAVKGKKL